MSEALVGSAGVALVPCYNEARNPVDLGSVLTSIPGLSVAFLDDGSEPASREVLNGLERPGVSVIRNERRAGKVASLTAAMRALDPSVRKVLTVDCDVEVSRASIEAVLDELERADLVVVNPKAIARSRSVWERGAIFSANRHHRLCDRFFERYPARCANGRLFGMSARMVEAILRSDVPRHTEDSHFMLLCLSEGYTYSYLREATLQYRAPDTLDDYLRQTSRFSEGRSLLEERWPSEMLERYYDLAPADVLGTFAAEALRDPAGALVFSAMLAAKFVQRRNARSQNATWAVAGSTKALR
ncbi:MAG TPA: glycosyltransferase [Candidatus Baltobacteraceae bacterium]|nr:glycosyltransferase [Candidatus Baltobacteraceae bacterium]